MNESAHSCSWFTRRWNATPKPHLLASASARCQRELEQRISPNSGGYTTLIGSTEARKPDFGKAPQERARAGLLANLSLPLPARRLHHLWRRHSTAQEQPPGLKLAAGSDIPNCSTVHLAPAGQLPLSSLRRRRTDRAVGTYRRASCRTAFRPGPEAISTVPLRGFGEVVSINPSIRSTGCCLRNRWNKR